MRHRIKTKKLNRNKAHREALLRNLVKSLILKKSIITTSVKAKETKKLAERLITFARKNDTNAHRYIFKHTGDKKVVKRFFSEVMPQLSDRKSGNIRLIKTGIRKGDGADMSLIEFIFAEKKQERKPKQKLKARIPKLRRKKKTEKKEEAKPGKEKKETKAKKEKKKKE